MGLRDDLFCARRLVAYYDREYRVNRVSGHLLGVAGSIDLSKEVLREQVRVVPDSAGV